MSATAWQLPSQMLAAGATIDAMAGFDASYPASNLADLLPGKPARVKSSWRVHDNNKWVDFDEGSGTLSASVGIGTYDDASLASAIEAAMNAAGSLTYTVAWSTSTGKWTISATGTFSLLGASGPNASKALQVDLGFGSSDLTGSSSYTAALVKVHNEAWLQLDLGASTAVGCLWAMGTTLSSAAQVRLYRGSIPAVGATISSGQTWRAWFDGSASVSLVADLTLGTGFLADDDDDFLSAYRDADQTDRYWFLWWQDPVLRSGHGPATGWLHEFGRLDLGPVTRPARSASVRGHALDWRDTSQATRGVALAFGVDLPPRRALALQWQRVATADVADVEALWRARRTPHPVWWDTSRQAAGGMYAQGVSDVLARRYRPVDQWDLGPLAWLQVPRRRV